MVGSTEATFPTAVCQGDVAKTIFMNNKQSLAVPSSCPFWSDDEFLTSSLAVDFFFLFLFFFTSAMWRDLWADLSPCPVVELIVIKQQTRCLRTVNNKLSFLSFFTGNISSPSCRCFIEWVAPPCLTHHFPPHCEWGGESRMMSEWLWWWWGGGPGPMSLHFIA